MAVLNAIDWDTLDAEAEGSRASIAYIAPRILLADDQEEILRTIATMLQEEFEIVGLAENGAQVLDLALKRCPDVLVLDIFMPVLNGMDAAARLNASGCPAKVLFLTVVEDLDFIETAISMGVLGYVLKPRLATDLIPAIRSVLQGRLYISPCMHWS
ncbi:MAG TPA: response regulator transcription factor [Terriglobales bacterium]|nr:response regulator transcription factor [Terriglobales bacterium]